MALPVSGPISLADIAAEFGGATPHALSEYYGVASGIPTAGNAISLGNFHGKFASITNHANDVGGLYTYTFINKASIHDGDWGTRGYIPGQGSTSIYPHFYFPSPNLTDTMVVSGFDIRVKFLAVNGYTSSSVFDAVIKSTGGFSGGFTVPVDQSHTGGSIKDVTFDENYMVRGGDAPALGTSGTAVRDFWNNAYLYLNVLGPGGYAFNTDDELYLYGAELTLHG